jgi:hypothetical protein
MKGNITMPTRISRTQQELDEAPEDIGRVKETLQEAHSPEVSPETMASAIGQALETADYEDEDGERNDEAEAEEE